MAEQNRLSGIKKLIVAIEGEQDSGKTILAEAIQVILREAGKTCFMSGEGVWPPPPPNTDVLIRVSQSMSAPTPTPKFKLGETVSAVEGTGVDPSIIFVVKNSYPTPRGMTLYQLESDDGEYTITRFAERQLVAAYPRPTVLDYSVSSCKPSTEPDVKQERYAVGKEVTLLGTYKYDDMLTLIPGTVAKIKQITTIERPSRLRIKLDIFVKGMYVANVPSEVFEKCCLVHADTNGTEIID